MVRCNVKILINITIYRKWKAQKRKENYNNKWYMEYIPNMDHMISPWIRCIKSSSTSEYYRHIDRDTFFFLVTQIVIFIIYMPIMKPFVYFFFLFFSSFGVCPWMKLDYLRNLITCELKCDNLIYIHIYIYVYTYYFRNGTLGFINWERIYWII